jgi:uncharacterized PurR-regulated membrane protein YhhQ (DUF165 family)
MWSILYLTCVLLADYTASLFIPFPFFGLLSLGTIIFGVTFTARDHVHRLGRAYVYTLIAITVLASIALSALTAVPIRIIVASAIAIALSETADTEVYQALRARRWLLRVLSSNAISVPLDTLLFIAIAFYGVFATPVLIEIIAADIVVKFAVGAFVAGLRKETHP